MGLGASRCPTLKDPSWQTRLFGSSSHVKRGGQASQTVGVLLTHQPWARGYPAQGVHQGSKATSRPVWSGGSPIN